MATKIESDPLREPSVNEASAESRQAGDAGSAPGFWERLFGQIPHVPDPWPNPWKRYSFAFGCFAASAVLRLTLGPFMMAHERGLILFVPAVITAEFFAGLNAGIVTAILSIAAGWYLSVIPFQGRLIPPGSLFGLATYVPVFAIVLWLTHWATAATRQLQADKEKMKSLAARERLLMDELRHRTKNIFAVVQGLIAQSLKETSNVTEAREALLGRVIALSRADNRLEGKDARRCSLQSLIHAELEPFGVQYAANGTDLLLDRKATVDFALLLHELATNAVKYGALSTEKGKVELAWFVADSGQPSLRFSWRERDGPPVKMPSRNGFGTLLIKSMFPRCRLEYRSSGFLYEAEIPLAQAATHEMTRLRTGT